MRALKLSLCLLLFAAGAFAEDRLGSYIFSRGNHWHRVRIIDHDWPDGAGAMMRRDESFCWFVYDGRAYIVRDAATLDAIDDLFAPLRALGAEHRDLSARLRPLERRERDLERESARWERRLDRNENDREAETHLRDLEQRIRDVETEIRKLEPEEEQLDQKEEKLE